MADLSQLFQASPGAAAILLGQNNALDQSHKRGQIDELAQIIQGRKLQNEYDSQVNPLKVTNQSLINQGLQAELPGKVALSDSHIADAQFKQQTLPGKVESTNSTYQDTLEENKFKKLERTSKALVDLASDPYSGKVPGYAYSRMVKEMGLNPDSELGRKLAVMSPEETKTYLSTKATALAQLSQTYQVDEMKKKYDKEIHAATDASHERINNANNLAGRYAKKEQVKGFENQTDAMLLAAKGDVEKTYSILSQAIPMAIQAQEYALAQKYQLRMQSIEPQYRAKINQVKPNTPDLGKLSGIPVTPTLDPTSPYARVPIGPTAPDSGPPQAPATAGGPQIKQGGQAGSYAVGDIVIGKGGKRYRYVGGSQTDPNSFKEVQ